MYMYSDHTEQFAGKKVVQWKPGDAIPDPATTIPCIKALTQQRFEDLGEAIFTQFLADPASHSVTGLVFGMMTDMTENYGADVIDLLIKHAEHLPHLTALFLGDIEQDESEISWIEFAEMADLFATFPQLEHFGFRGCASNYSGSIPHLGVLQLERLKTLIIESGSMDRSVIQDILRSHLPALEHLELWTGSASYEANVTVEDFAPLFADTLFPNLRYLGIRNSEIANDVASALSQSPLLEHLRVLDLSLGWFDDTGATALLNSPATKGTGAIHKPASLQKLEKLDLHHHFCSEEVIQRLQALGIDVDVSDRQEFDIDDDGEEERYVAVAE